MKDLVSIFTAEESGRLLARLSYDVDEIEDLHASGMAAINLAGIPEENRFEILGSNPIDLFSCDGSFHLLRTKSAPGIILVDFYSGAALRPIELRPVSLFGRRGLELQIPLTLPQVSLSYRWRFNRISVFLASSESELESAAANIVKSVPVGNIAFRGQTRLYEIARRARIREFLYGDESAKEPSLVTTAFRHHFPYVSAERYWHAIIADIDYRLTGYKDKRWHVEDDRESVSVGVSGEIAQWHYTSTMAIAQHYGIPTYGLDVTTSIKTAWWFATHTFDCINGLASYAPYIWSGLDQNQWPIIYVFRGGNGMRITNLELSARRPERQDAVFVSGGWGSHANACADDLVAIIMLAPKLGAAPRQVAEIFPSPEEDPIYAELLKLKSRFTANQSLFKTAGLQYLFELS
jgi:hypothetical protein